jgi:hypothetical protein
MSSQLKIEDVDAALQAALVAANLGAQVSGISDQNFDNEGNLIIVPPAVLVLFESETLTAQRSNTRLDYTADKQFSILCGARNFAGDQSEKVSAYQLATKVRDALAGLKLLLADGSKTEPITLLGVQREQFDSNGTWYSVLVSVGGTAQFTVKP